MNKYDIVTRIEEFAPLDTQESWDASGWGVDLEGKEVHKILFALTVTDDVVNQARQKGCDMIISHHPLFFVPFEYKDINIYSAHTNLDRAEGGTSDLIIEKLGFKKIIIPKSNKVDEKFEGIQIVKAAKIIEAITSCITSNT